jgi:addiction module HigA family antidote
VPLQVSATERAVTDLISIGCHPGFLLRDLIFPALRLSVSQAARDLQVTRQTLHRILSGQAAITPDMALRLEKLCGISSVCWLARQSNYELKKMDIEILKLIPLIPSHLLPKDVAERVEGEVHA